MKDLFWVCPNKTKDHYILYLKDYDLGHVAISTADSLERLMTCYRNLILRYRNETRFIERLNSMMEIPRVNDMERQRLNGLYDLYSKDYEDLLNETYDLARDDLKVIAKKENPFNRVMSLMKKDPKTLGQSSPQVSVQEVIPPPKTFNTGSLLKRLKQAKI